MTSELMKPLSLGTSFFSALRQRNQIYVDKTSMIYEMARVRGKYLITRPRRFGKSLLVSTFESLFKNGLKDFKGLAIEDRWNDKTYTVVRLDFSESKEFSSVEEFAQKFHERIESKFNAAGVALPQTKESFITRLSNGLQALPGSSLVLLIDEYDVPLTACMHNRDSFNAVRSIISELFLSIKANEGCLRFFFMTGITKFSNTSIFSAFNNLSDLSMDSEYGTLLGLTEEEIKHDFAEYLQKASSVLKVSEQEVLDRLRSHYDGFSFDEEAKTHVYCPWSVLNFFSRPHRGFENYWYQSGGQPTVLMSYLTHHALVQPSRYSETVLLRKSQLASSLQYNEIDTDVLLAQAGYLSIKEVVAGDYLRLGYPNQEVASSMAQLYADEMLRSQNRLQLGIPMYPVMMANESVDTIIDHFNKVFNAIDFNRYPIVDEASCRAFLQVLLIGAAMMPRVETHTAHGRSDLEVDAGQRHWVFEFKFAQSGQDVNGLLNEAVQQVKDRQYGEVPHTKDLIRVALVFEKEKRQFVAWATV